MSDALVERLRLPDDGALAELESLVAGQPDRAARAAWAALLSHESGSPRFCARLLSAMVRAWGRARAEAWLLRQWTIGPACEREWARANVCLALRDAEAASIGLALALYESSTSTVLDRRMIREAIEARGTAPDLAESLRE